MEHVMYVVERNDELDPQDHSGNRVNPRGRLIIAFAGNPAV